jgi:hypothetical protein
MDKKHVTPAGEIGELAMLNNENPHFTGVPP